MPLPLLFSATPPSLPLPTHEAMVALEHSNWGVVAQEPLFRVESGGVGRWGDKERGGLTDNRSHHRSQSSVASVVSVGVSQAFP